MSPSDIATIASSAFAGVSALLAAAAIYFPSRTNESQQTLNQAVISLERAYEVLSGGDTKTRPPAADRLNWLTAARHIERYKALKKSITNKTHLTICEEQEEYWRHKFYTCLDSPDLFHQTYYMEKLTSPITSGVEPRSALVVHAFAKWPDGRADPIDKVDAASLIRDGKALEGNYGLRDYLSNIPKYNIKA
jgi:hypothetical protein